MKMGFHLYATNQLLKENREPNNWGKSWRYHFTIHWDQEATR